MKERRGRNNPSRYEITRWILSILKFHNETARWNLKISCSLRLGPLKSPTLPYFFNYFTIN